MVNQNINGILDIKKTTFDVICDVRDGWIDRQGNIIPNESHHHVEKALELLASFDEEAKQNGREPIHIEQFKAANMNRGYDAAEWLVIRYGYIAIEGYKAIYYTNNRQKPTQKQCKKISCILNGDTLIDVNTELGKKIAIGNFKNDYYQKKRTEAEKKAQRERQWCIDNKEYYSRWENQFHSPSGFTRRDYLRWQQLCKKHGVATSTRRTYFTSC